ncbi:MAG: cache domain-containing protein [Myxococcales bacterium]|nr:cache domain-containing protein [Myxococcales bacterium]
MRLKIIAGNLIFLLAAGLIAFFHVSATLKDGLAERVESQITNDLVLMQRSWRLSGMEFMADVEGRAGVRALRSAIGAMDEESKRERTFAAAESVAQWFRDPARRGELPDIVVITDETGKVIARNLDIGRLYGAQLTTELPSLRQVLADGRPRHDVWRRPDQNKVLQVALAPIRNEDGAVVGALLVGFDLSNGLASSEASVLSRDVAFLVEGSVYSSSLAGGRGAELQEQLFSGSLAAGTAAALQGTPSASYSVTLEGDEYVGVTAPLPMAPSVDVAFAVLANRTAGLNLASVSMTILLMTLLGALGIAAYGFLLGGSFLRPIEEIEEGILAVINGRTDTRLDIESAEYGGLAYRINQLINAFTGVSETDEQGHVAPSGGWAPGGESASDSSPPPGAPTSAGGPADPNAPIDDPQLAASLEAEPEAEYQARVFREYAAAKLAAGEDVSNIPLERFAKRIDGNGAALAQKHGCRAVRFQVETRGNQVILRPVLIR